MSFSSVCVCGFLTTASSSTTALFVALRMGKEEPLCKMAQTQINAFDFRENQRATNMSAMM